MKKVILLILTMYLAAPAEEIDFFGLKKSDTAVNNVIKLVEGLIDGDQEKVTASYARVEELDPELAKSLKVDELKILCSRCNGTGALVTGKTCGKCNGSGLMTDANSLRFLMDQFSIALDKEPSDAAAWKKARGAFDECRSRISAKKVLTGTVIRKESNGLLLSLQPDNQEVHLKNVDATQTYKGTPISGTAWRDGTYSYTNSLGETNTVPSYTASLWGS